MPFTFAHPFYAVPLKLLKPAWFSTTGLILGSMSPDFEYFIALEPYQKIGHTHMGLLLEAIPLSILFAYLFHRIIRLPLSIHLPSVSGLDAKAVRLIKPWNFHTIGQWIVFLLSVAAGFYTHIFLDGFTHDSGFYVKQLPFLQNTLAGIPLYKIGQHSLSLIGLLGLLAMAAALLRGSPPAEELYRAGNRQKLMFWLIAAAVALMTVALKLILSDSTNYIGILVVSALSGGMLGITVASVIWMTADRRLRTK